MAEIHDFTNRIWASLEPVLGDIAETVHGRFPTIRSDVGKIETDALPLVGFLTFRRRALGPTSEEDVVVRIVCQYQMGQRRGRRIVQCDSCVIGGDDGMTCIAEGPKIETDLDRSDPRQEEEVGDWISKTRAFLLQSSDLILKELRTEYQH